MYFQLKQFQIISVIVLSSLVFLAVNPVYAGSGDHDKSDKGHHSGEQHGHKFSRLLQKIEDLEARVDQLEQGGGPQTIAVDCAAGETVSDALASVANSSTPVTITISGVCQENVEIHRDNVTLQGGSTADGIEAGDPAKNALLVIDGVANIKLYNLSLSGGVNALAVAESSAVFASGVNISNASAVGLICLDASSCMLYDVAFQDNPYSVLAYGGSAVTFVGGSITNTAIQPFPNPNIGIIASSSSTVTLSSQLPGDPLVLPPPAISNSFFGIYASGGTVFLNAGVVENTITGIVIEAGGSLRREPQAGTATIQNNNQGIFLSNMGILQSTAPQPLNINNNTLLGINCDASADNFEYLVIDAVFSGNGNDKASTCP